MAQLYATRRRSRGDASRTTDWVPWSRPFRIQLRTVWPPTPNQSSTAFVIWCGRRKEANVTRREGVDRRHPRRVHIHAGDRGSPSIGPPWFALVPNVTDHGSWSPVIWRSNSESGARIRSASCQPVGRPAALTSTHPATWPASGPATGPDGGPWSIGAPAFDGIGARRDGVVASRRRRAVSLTVRSARSIGSAPCLEHHSPNRMPTSS